MIITMMASSISRNEWCLDSGATTHMYNARDNFQDFKDNVQTIVQTAVKGGPGTNAKAVGIGTVKISINVNGMSNDIKLQNVTYVPELRSNLISVSRIVENGCTVRFTTDTATVLRKNGTIAMTAKKKGRLYIVKTTKTATAMHAKQEDSALNRWHSRLGHLNFNDLRKMKNKEMVIGLKFDSNEETPSCIVCDKAKIHKLPFKSSTTREQKTLGLVHSDICGPMKVSSLGGANYFVTFIDDRTRFITIVMLKKRSDVFKAFRKYKERVERETEKKIIRFRTDNGKEYLSLLHI